MPAILAEGILPGGERQRRGLSVQADAPPVTNTGPIAVLDVTSLTPVEMLRALLDGLLSIEAVRFEISRRESKFVSTDDGDQEE